MGIFDAIGDVLGIGDSAGDKAIDAQSKAANAANDTQMAIYTQNRNDYAPWREAGVKALGGLQDEGFSKDFTMNDFTADPGYAFRMSEGSKALERSAAARGSLNSGGTLKALTRYGQGVASDEYNNAYTRFNADRDRRFNRLSSIAGLGQTAQAATSAAGQNYGNNVSSNQIGVGNSVAANTIGQANRDASWLQQGITGGASIIASDERLKEDLEPIPRDDILELRKTLKPYFFRYKNSEKYGAGKWAGIMAQDLEKTKLGKLAIVYDKLGFRHIDTNKLNSILLAVIAEAA